MEPSNASGKGSGPSFWAGGIVPNVYTRQRVLRQQLLVRFCLFSLQLNICFVHLKSGVEPSLVSLFCVPALPCFNKLRSGSAAPVAAVGGNSMAEQLKCFEIVTKLQSFMEYNVFIIYKSFSLFDIFFWHRATCCGRQNLLTTSTPLAAGAKTF